MVNLIQLVPDMPSRADLSIVSQDKLQFQFLPPASDGGAAVTAYKVRVCSNNRLGG